MNRARLPLTIVLATSLLATGLMRAVVQGRRERILPRPAVASRLSGLDSFAMGMLLGGLRGPLVMVLWSSIENQKIARNLEDIDTKIEWIRMLQPEFDSVHTFQMWNKAYNLSVMMANIQNKYTTILDALDYGRSVDQHRPDNVSILFQMGEIYFNKLGNPVGPSADRRYYIARLRQETLPGSLKASALQKGQPGWRRTRHDVLLDANGFILPELLAPRPQTGSLAAHGYTGAELQYLDRYNTPEAGGFPYGVHPLALAYNYQKRAAVIQAATGRRHVQMGESVVNSRPGIALKYWSESEWEEARRLEAEALGKLPLPDEKVQLEPLTASLPVGAAFVDNSPGTRKLIERALFLYRRAAMVSLDAATEFRRHIAQSDYADDASTFFWQIDSAAALTELMLADRAYLAAMAAAASFNDPIVAKDQVDSLRRSAADHYRKAIDLYYLVILKYYTEDQVANAVFPQLLGKAADGQDYSRSNVQNADPKLYPRVHQVAQAYRAAEKIPADWAEDVMEYEAYIRRATERLSHLE